MGYLGFNDCMQILVNDKMSNIKKIRLLNTLLKQTNISYDILFKALKGRLQWISYV